MCQGRLCNDGNLLKTMQSDPLEREKLEGKKERLSSEVMSLSRSDVPTAHCRACSLSGDIVKVGGTSGMVWYCCGGSIMEKLLGGSNLFSHKV